MGSCRFIGLLVGFAVCSSVAQAQGGLPLETDDPGTVAGRHWELNLAVIVSREPDATVYEAPLADANYGVAEGIQLKLEIPLLSVSGPTGRTRLGNPLIGLKWRFLGDSSSGIAVSTYPQLEIRSSFLVPDSAKNDPDAMLLPVELAKHWGMFGVNAEVGYRIVSDTPDELIYGLALSYQAGATLELLTECNGSSDRSKVTQLLCQLGARQQLGEHFGLLGAFGTGVAGERDERPHFHLYLGLQSRW